jgi:hypothetical protein
MQRIRPIAPGALKPFSTQRKANAHCLSEESSRRWERSARSAASAASVLAFELGWQPYVYDLTSKCQRTLGRAHRRHTAFGVSRTLGAAREVRTRQHQAIEGLAAAKAAAARGVEVIPLSRYAGGRKLRERLHLGFAAVDARELRRGVRELAVVLESLSGDGRRNGV